jgi:hypothetical protein
MGEHDVIDTTLILQGSRKKRPRVREDGNEGEGLSQSEPEIAETSGAPPKKKSTSTSTSKSKPKPKPKHKNKSIAPVPAAVDDSASNTVNTAEIIDVDAIEEPSTKSVSHRLQMKYRPNGNCAADNSRFRGSKSLVYTFLVIKEGSAIYNNDGVLVACNLECNFCKGEKKAPGATGYGSWRYGQKGRDSTGNFRKHFQKEHKEQWGPLEEEDAIIMGTQKVEEMTQTGMGQTTLDQFKVFT